MHTHRYFSTCSTEESVGLLHVLLYQLGRTRLPVVQELTMIIQVQYRTYYIIPIIAWVGACHYVMYR